MGDALAGEVIGVEIGRAAAGLDHAESRNRVAVLRGDRTDLVADVSAWDVTEVAWRALQDAEIWGSIPKSSGAGGIADAQIRVGIEGIGASVKASSIDIRVGSVRAGGDADEVDVVDEVVGQALADAGSVAGDVLPVEVVRTDVDADFDVGVCVREQLDSGVAGTIIGADIVDRVSIVSWWTGSGVDTLLVGLV